MRVPHSTSELQHMAARGKSAGKINSLDRKSQNQATRFEWRTCSNGRNIHVASQDRAMIDDQRPKFNHVQEKPIWRMFNVEMLGGNLHVFVSVWFRHGTGEAKIFWCWWSAFWTATYSVQTRVHNDKISSYLKLETKRKVSFFTS